MWPGSDIDSCLKVFVYFTQFSLYWWTDGFSGETQIGFQKPCSTNQNPHRKEPTNKSN